MNASLTEAVDVQNKHKQPSANWYLYFIMVLLVAAAARLYQLGTESLWIDEGFSLRDATHQFTFAKASKPLYYWLLTPWVRVGDSDWFLRIPAVVFGVASVGVIYLLGRLIWGNRAGFLAALLAAVSPLHVNHSQEIRMYTLLTLLVLISIYFCVLTVRTWKFRYMFGCALFAWLSILTQPMACLLLLVTNLAVLDAYLRRRRPLLPWVLLQVAVVAAWLPWLQYVLGFGKYFEQSWASLADKPTAADMPKLWGEFGIGEWNPRFSGRVMRLVLLAYTYGSLILLSAFAWLDRRRPETRLIFYWFIVPGAALLVLSTVKLNALIPRYLVFTAPAFVLLLGAMWAGTRSRMLFLALAVLLFLVPVGKLIRYYQKTTRPEWSRVVSYVMQHQKPTDYVGVYRFGNKYIFDHYYKGQAKWGPLGPENLLKSQMLGWNEKKALDLIAEIPPAPRKWLVVSRIPLAAEQYIDDALTKYYRVLDRRRYEGIRVYLFEDVRK